nr:S41 family peptidase [Arthrobacter gengyunqii]
MPGRGAGVLSVALLVLASHTGCAATAEVPPEQPSTERTEPAPTTPSTRQDYEFSADDYVDEALSFIEANGLFINEIDWTATRTSVTAQTADARTPEETHQALEEALLQAGGRHSGLQPAGTGGAFAYAPTPKAKKLPGGVVVLTVPAFRSPRSEHIDAYAAGAEEIAAHAGDASCGWIVDLQRNYGGNMWPMLAALTPLLPDGDLMQLIDRDGNPSRVSAEGNEVFFDGKMLSQTTEVDYEDEHRPVAIVQGSATASSAEAVILSFSSREDVRSFGAPSAGLVTGNIVHTLPDGTVLRMTRTHMATGDGQMPLGPIPPDEISPEDPIQAASDWLLDECNAAPSPGN